MVAAELGVDTLEGGVTVGLGLLDTVDFKRRWSVFRSLSRVRCSCCIDSEDEYAECWILVDILPH